MDGPTFQLELHQLKQQIAELANKRRVPTAATRPDTSSPTSYDAFSQQLGDLKTNLEDLDGRLHAARAESQANIPWSQCTANPQVDYQGVPSDPMLWRILKSLQNDVRSADSRIIGLERSISDLEDRIDRAQPQFTPPGSTNGSASSWNEQERTEDARSKAAESRLSEAEAFPQEQMLRQKLELASVTMSTLKKYNKTMLKQNCQLDEENAKVMRDMIALNAGLHGINTQSSSSITQAAKRTEAVDHETHSGMQDTLYEPHGHYQDVDENAAIPPGAVAFRNLEIARLDEQLCRTQEELRASEQHLADKEVELDHMHRIRETSAEAEERIASMQNSLLDREKEIVQLSEVMREKDHKIERLSADCRQMYRNSQQGLTELREASASTQSLLGNLERQKCQWDEERAQLMREHQDEMRKMQALCEYKDEVAEEQNRVIAEGARLIRLRDDEIDRLDRRFKAAVDDVGHERRKNSRLTRLLRERDDEIGAMKAGIEHACIIPRRSPRDRDGDLKYPDKQLSLLKARLEVCSQVAGVLGPNDYDLVEHSHPDGRFQAFAVSLKGPKKSYKLLDEPAMLAHQDVPKKSQQPNENDVRLSDEMQSGPAWQHHARHATVPSSGKPNLHGRDGDNAARTGPESFSKEVRYIDGNGNTIDDDLRERPQARPDTSRQLQAAQSHPNAHLQYPANGSPVAAQEKSRSKRHGPPLSDSTYRPPLPAPVMPHRMHSVGDLRSTSERKSQSPKGFSRHRSMQQLPRKSLQAYVETEEEESMSGGPNGGDV
ncbi:hypothetical protein D0869_11152 [Hortaea werneckii]|uniref:Uncharacterized protein n=1 Tax=Hortaea werneckii TaxID=91943 RepID=A0A3M6WCG7_HORWE|nr:hypothetical protein KC324_g8772 [Hortaea werneckii]KAI7581694.1 hypothetical protein KC316_g8311 [Hortaea werneckii]RMX75966.1 hypothetical protein D0869_11152 [Hortaea werneckii]RMY14884.1 hypothetical protein D0867_07003 [Hortaea werneckii]RMY40889.1 hypothetical protein D0866_00962 [Hortaea werneckii]